MKVSFKYEDGTQIHLQDCPLTAQEVLFNDWIDFRECVLEIDAISRPEVKEEKDFETSELFKEYVFEVEESIKQTIAATYRACSKLVKDKTLYEFPYSNGEDTDISSIVGMYNHLLSLGDVYTARGVKDPSVEIILEPKRGNIRQKVAKAFRAIRKTPGIYFIAKDGKIYGLPKARIERWAGQKNLRTGEMVEMLEVQRMGQQAIEQTKDPAEIGTIDFTMGLSQAAILLRRPDEPLPVDEGEREAFIKERIGVMKDIPLSVICNTRSFFLITTIQFARRHSVNGLSKTSNRLTLETRSKEFGRQ